jgi:SAM-dependent methyltransferase
VDDIIGYNKERWEDLARNNVLYSRPYAKLTPEFAREQVDLHGVIGEIAGKDVLALASGGGQQTAAFAMLGARVTVFDFSETQLARDRAMLEAHKLEARIEQGDMRDLSRFADDSFDIVWHAFSISFVPDVRPVFDEIARVIRPGGVYRTHFHNPFVHGTSEEDASDGGYVIGREPYREGEVNFRDPDWTWFDEDGEAHRVKGPREFRHTLSTMVNGLIARGFSILGLYEEQDGDPNAAYGSREHYMANVPPWLYLYARYAPQQA